MRQNTKYKTTKLQPPNVKQNNCKTPKWNRTTVQH